MEAAGPGAFGRRLRELREAASLSQEELAERANLSSKAIGALERGERRRPYPTTVRALGEALGLDEALARELAAAARGPVADTAPAPVPAGVLPQHLSPMVGRDHEVALVLELLGPGGARVVTVTGPGGVGKTRLAWEVSEHLVAEGRDLVIVELAPVRRADLVAPTIARSLGLPIGSGETMGSIAEALVHRHAVLVLDNVEHLLGIATDIADLVRRCAGIAVLATSRAPMRIRAEHEVPLGPLGVPAGAADVDDLAAAPAAQVFVDRARSVVPGFVLDRTNAPAVHAICRRLDGLPLALELAAAHLRYLGPELLLDRLDHAIGSAGLRDLPERQRTIRATLDWSHDLLTADEQRLLHALSVFAGGFDVDAAEQVTGPWVTDVVTALEGLVEQSLVIRPDLGGTGTTTRFRLLEPVRDYAAERLSADETGALGDRHADHFVGLGDRALPGLHGPDQASWLDRLELEHANLRGALTSLLDRGRFDLAARLGRSTWLYWALRGHAGEGLRWWQRVLDADAGELDHRARASAHLTMAGLRLASGGLDEVRTQAASAVEHARAAQDHAVLAEALVLRCTAATFTGDLGAAAGYLDELGDLGSSVDDPWIAAHVFVVRAQLALMRSDLDGAGRALDAAEELARGSAGPFTLGTVLNLRATLGEQLGDDDAALDSAAEAAQLAAVVGTPWTLVYTLSALATQASRRSRPDLAAALFAAVEATAEASALAVSFAPDLDAARAHQAEIRAQLDDEELARARQRGRAATTDDVLAMVAEIRSAPAPS